MRIIPAIDIINGKCVRLSKGDYATKIIRLHNELNVNLEGIDVVFNLLEKEKQLRDELTALKNRIRLYENE
mgnify:CR=1 FL=1